MHDSLPDIRVCCNATRDLEYIGKLISLAALGYLFFQVSLSTILFGHKKPRFDLVIILTYFLFIIKNVMGFAKAKMEEVVVFERLYSFMLNNSVLIEKYSFYLGAILLLFVSLYMVLKFEIKKTSFMSLLHETGAPRKKYKSLLRGLLPYS